MVKEEKQQIEGKLSVAAYCRVSTDREDQANSLVSQRLYFQKYIENHQGWELYQVYFDEGISGTQAARRKGFLTMIQDARNGKLDLILTKEVSRFARNTVDTLAYTRALKALGIGVLFTIDNIDTRDCDGELRLTIMASIAQEESRKTSERVRWGQKRRMEQGVVFGRDLLGYQVRGGALFRKEEEVPVVQAIFHKYTNEGKGTGVIARELLEEGMYPKRSRKWSNTMILKVLRNEKYVGDLCQKKTITPDYLTHAKKYNHGEEEMVYLRDHHEPIIDRSLWKRTQQELIRRSPHEEQKARHNNRYWYSGRLRCGQCGSAYVARRKKRKDGTVYLAFRCGTSAREGSRKVSAKGEVTGCDSIQIHEKMLLSCLAFVLGQMPVDENKLKKEILEEVRSLGHDILEKTNSHRLWQEIQDLQERKHKAVDLMLNGTLTKEELIGQKTWYEEQIQKLSLHLEREQAQEEMQREQAAFGESGTKELEKEIDAAWDSGILFKELIEKVVIYNNSSIEISFPFLPFPIRVFYRTYGKGTRYGTEIVNMEIGEKEQGGTKK